MEQRQAARELDDAPSWEEVKRAVNAMKRGKAGGEDAMVAEYLKLGGLEIQRALHKLVKRCWEEATLAPDGEEHESWPPKWKVGVIIPLWKRKGIERTKTHGEA